MFCKRCGQHKPETDFYFRDRAKGTRKKECKLCTCIYVKQYQEINKEAISKRRKAAYAADPDAARANARRWAREHLEENRARAIAWNKANADRYNERRRADYERNPEPRLSSSKKWQHANPDKCLEYNGRYRSRKLNAPVVEKVDRKSIIERDNSTCYICGKRCEAHELHLDHVIPLTAGGHHSADNLRVACRRCNSRKGAKIDFIKEEANG